MIRGIRILEDSHGLFVRHGLVKARPLASQASNKEAIDNTVANGHTRFRKGQLVDKRQVNDGPHVKLQSRTGHKETWTIHLDNDGFDPVRESARSHAEV